MSNKLVDIMNKASEEVLRSQSKANLKIKGFLYKKAQDYIEIKAEISALEKKIDRIKKELREGGSFEYDDIKVKVSYGSTAARVKPLKDFINAGFTENLLSEKNLLFYYNTGDRVTVTQKKKYKRSDQK